MKIDFRFVFKAVYLIVSLPLLIVICLINDKINSIFYELLLTTIIVNTIIIIDMYNDRDYIKYKIKNPDKRKIGYLFLYIAIFTVFYIPKIVFKPILEVINNLVLMYGILMIYVIFSIFYGIFIYKLIRDYNISPRNFNPFKKIKNIGYMELIAYELDKINTYQKMMIAKNRLIVINKSGIYEIINFDKKGFLIGDINNKQWEYNDSKINNPFLLIGDNINNYIISNNYTKFTLKGVGLVSRGSIKLLIERNLQNNVFDDKKIDEIYDELGDKYGYNKDKIH